MNGKFLLYGLFFCLSLISLTGCSSGQGNGKEKPQTGETIPIKHEFHPLSENVKQRNRDSIEVFFRDRLKLEGFHGMVLVARNGEILYERYLGMANEAEKIPFGPETPVHVASISKTLTAVAVLRLVDQGKIKLDDEVRTYLKGFPYKGITIRMLLNHRSGLPYYGYFSKKMIGNKPLTNKRILRILKYHRPKLNVPPNTHFSYCNTNFALLALIVEKVTHQSFPEAMQELIFQPLHMDHSYIATPGDHPKQQALSYNSKGILQAETELDPVYGDKNLYTTVRDLLRFDKATYNDAFLSAKMKTEMFRGYSYERPGKANYGLGIRMREEEGYAPYFFHTGWWHGNTGCYVTMREDTTCMIMLSNHLSRKVYAIHQLSPEFGNYPFDELKED